MQKGDAHEFQLPDGKTVAVWCERPGFGMILGEQTTRSGLKTAWGGSIQHAPQGACPAQRVIGSTRRDYLWQYRRREWGERGGDLVAVGPNLLVEFVEGCYDAHNNRRNTRETRDKFRGWQEFFRHSDHDENCCWRRAAEETGRALLAAEAEIGFSFRAVG